MDIARLEPVALRDLWRHEAHDFTTWLANNLDLLSNAIGTDLSLVGTETSAGAFSADILAEDSQGNSVIIENQLERTDHDHLGKLITYMSNLEAKIAIWVTSDPRPEHETAVHWLNEALPADTGFYLVKIQAYRIGDSSPAPLLTVVAGPTEAAREIGQQKKDLAERHIRRLQFWEQLLERAKPQTSLHARISPGKESWISAGAGRTGLGYNYVILQDGARVELYIDTGDGELNKMIFDALADNRQKIEDTFGMPLHWQRLDDKRACRIAHIISIGGLADEDSWLALQHQMIDAMVALERTLQPHIKGLKG